LDRIIFVGTEWNVNMESVHAINPRFAQNFAQN